MALSWLVIVCILVAILVVFPLVMHRLFSAKIPSLSLENAKVLITGGSQGIGYETAKYCISKGASVILVARTQAKLDESQSKLDRFLLKPKYADQLVATVSADVSNFEELEERISNCMKEIKWSNLDVLVCNAGVEYVGKLVDTPLAQQRKIMDINHFGCVNTIYACHKYLKKDSNSSDKSISRVIVNSSTLGLIGMMCYSAYCASKFAMRGFVESIRNEFAADNIYVGIVYPPDTNTAQYQREKSMYDIPNEVRRISEDSGIFTAEQVGADIAKMVENGEYTHPWGTDGFMLHNLHCGMGPVTTFFDTFVQIFLLGIFRVIAMVYAKEWSNIGLKCMKDGKSKGSKAGKNETDDKKRS